MSPARELLTSASVHEAMNSLFDHLIDQLEKSDETSAGAVVDASGIPSVESTSETLLVLKAIHRQLFTDIQEAESEHNRKIFLQQKRQRGVEALLYEKSQLENRIRALKNFSTPSLLRLAREQRENADHGEDTKSSGADMEIDEEDLLRSYFGGREISNPDDRDFILRRLHDEINCRGKLEEAVKTKKEHLGGLLKELKSVTQLLTSLPQQVAAVERASMPLQKVFAPLTPLTGSERKGRIELAQALPPSLYALYRQLQLHNDFYQEADSEDDSRLQEDPLRPIPGESLGIENNTVLFQVPVPDPSALTSQSASGHRVVSSGKRVTIHFSYDDTLKVVTAVATGCATLLFQDALLQGLFPGDEELAGGEAGRTAKALPYRWCNYLAGLHLAPAPTSSLSTFPGTQVIMRELRRRVRANATLKHILQLLQRGTIPSLPKTVSSALDTPEPASMAHCKLYDFETTESIVGQPLIGEYSMTLTHEGGSLKAKVRINKARYPSEPPVWTLGSSTGTDCAAASNDPPLFDASLADIERHVNSQLINQLSSAPSTADSAFEWVLAIQLRLILASLVAEGSATSGSTRGKKRKTTSD